MCRCAGRRRFGTLSYGWPARCYSSTRKRCSKPRFHSEGGSATEGSTFSTRDSSRRSASLRMSVEKRKEAAGKTPCRLFVWAYVEARSSLLLEFEAARWVAIRREAVLSRVARVVARGVAAGRLVARVRASRVRARRCIAVIAGRRRHVLGDGHVLSPRRIAASRDRRIADWLAVAHRVVAIAGVRAIVVWRMAWGVRGAV